MTWEKKKILILVKAYPERSKKYGSSICTAGITEDNQWIRIYPIKFDYFIKKLKIKKFTWIEAEVQKAKEKLMRKESHNVKLNTIKIIDDSLANLSGSSSKKKEIWEKRRRTIRNMLNDSINELKQKWQEDRTSLGIIQPNLIDFSFRKDLGEIKIEKEKIPQKTLNGKKIYVADKIEHIISYKFKCNDERCSYYQEKKKNNNI